MMTIIFNEDRNIVREKIKKIKLIAFDFDGTLTKVHKTWPLIFSKVGKLKEVQELFKLCTNAIIDDEELIRRSVKLLSGIPLFKMKEIASEIELYDGVFETISFLKKHYKVVLITAGFDVISREILDLRVFDEVYANMIEVRDGYLTGEVNTLVTTHKKPKIITKIAEKNSLSLKECAAVGDGFSDIPIFKKVGFSVAFNPSTEDVIKFVDVLIKGESFLEVKELFEEAIY
ncbi:MAG: HAD family hydrolase [Candidatus Asgardarchaeia archaeon]